MDDAAWSQRPGPSVDEAERRARLQAYLDGNTIGRYSEQATSAIRQIDEHIDQRAWAAARGLSDPSAKLIALEAYLQRPGTLLYAAEAADAIAATRREIAELPPERLARVPLAILEQMPLASLATLDGGTLSQLSDDLLIQLPPASLARLSSEREQTLPGDNQVCHPRPAPWATRFGHDEIGAWAEFDLDQDDGIVMRFRYLLHIGTNGGVWLADTEKPRRQFGVKSAWAAHRAHVVRPFQCTVSNSMMMMWTSSSMTSSRPLPTKLTSPRQSLFRLPSLNEWRLAAAHAHQGPHAHDFPAATGPTPGQTQRLAWSTADGVDAPQPVATPSC